MAPKKVEHEDHIDESTLRYIMEQLDKDGDGSVTKEEYRTSYMNLFPKITVKDYDKVWQKIDKNGDGQLSFEELAAHYGYSLESGDSLMSDEQILEALQMQATLHEMQQAAEEKRKALGSPEPVQRRRSTNQVDGYKQKINSSGVKTIKMPASITLKEKDPEVLFLQACELGDESEILEALRDKKTNVRIVDDRGEMPMHKLARHGLVESIRRVVERLNTAKEMQNDLNWQDKQGKSPIFYAAEYGHSELVKLFMDMEVDNLVESTAGWTFLHAAVNGNNDTTVSVILEHPKCLRKALVHFQDRQDRTPLHIAAFKENGELTRLLLNAGAKVDAMDATGHSPSMLANRAGRKASKNYLEEQLKKQMQEAYPACES